MCSISFHVYIVYMETGVQLVSHLVHNERFCDQTLEGGVVYGCTGNDEHGGWTQGELTQRGGEADTRQ